MIIECHHTIIIKQWTTDNARKLNGFVLVEFTMQDQCSIEKPIRSQLIEYVSIKYNPDFSTARKKRRLTNQAIDQVRRYFDGDGARENIFVDGLSSPQASWLSPEQEAELQAELRIIEREFETAV